MPWSGRSNQRSDTVKNLSSGHRRGFPITHAKSLRGRAIRHRVAAGGHCRAAQTAVMRVVKIRESAADENNLRAVVYLAGASSIGEAPCRVFRGVHRLALLSSGSAREARDNHTGGPVRWSVIDRAVMVFRFSFAPGLAPGLIRPASRPQKEKGRTRRPASVPSHDRI